MYIQRGTIEKGICNQKRKIEHVRPTRIAKKTYITSRGTLKPAFFISVALNPRALLQCTALLNHKELQEHVLRKKLVPQFKFREMLLRTQVSGLRVSTTKVICCNGYVKRGPSCSRLEKSRATRNDAFWSHTALTLYGVGLTLWRMSGRICRRNKGNKRRITASKGPRIFYAVSNEPTFSSARVGEGI